MSVKVNVVTPEQETPSSVVKVSISPKEEPLSGVTLQIKEREDIQFQLKLRSALNGDLMVLDHKDIDIVIQPKNNKVVTFAKEIMSDVVYGAESRLLEYLRKNGIINYDSIQGGNIYGSLEGTLMDSTSFDPVKATLWNISEWMKTEEPYIKGTTAYEEMEDEALLDPSNQHSTELGEVPQSAEKGSIRQDSTFSPYIYGRYTY